MQGRVIFDNIMVAHEMLHTIWNKGGGKVRWLAAKLDMTKAYDRVEWDFLEGIMKKIGFADRWIQLVMSCVRSGSYSAVINGKQVSNILSSRGQIGRAHV